MTSGPGPDAESKSRISLLCAGAMRHIVEHLVGPFTREGGPAVAVTFERSGVVRDRVLAGAVVDVAITTRPALDLLAARGKIVPETAKDIANSAIGVAVRRGAPKPDVHTVQAFRQALLTAGTIAYADPATGSPSGNHLVKVFERLGIAGAIAGRTILIGAGANGSVVVVGDVVARGEAEIGLQQIAEIVPVAGVELAGPLPAELQEVTIFSAAVTASSANAGAARRLVDFLASPAAQATIVANGMEPP